MSVVNRARLDCELVTDVSGSWECEAAFRGQWFQVEWEELAGTPAYERITKELLLIMVAAAV